MGAPALFSCAFAKDGQFKGCAGLGQVASCMSVGGKGKEVRTKMATYIMLSRLSPEGVTTLKNNPDRVREVNREVEELGAKVVAQYALLGAYDFITVLDAPDSETVARISVELGSRRTASYETLTAIPVDEFISSLKG